MMMGCSVGWVVVVGVVVVLVVWVEVEMDQVVRVEKMVEVMCWC